MIAVALCPHWWEPAGFWGPYPTETCSRCGASSILPVEGRPNPFGVVLDALERAGCRPRPVEA